MGNIYYKETSRKKDQHCEQEINRFADKNFYPFFSEWFNADSVERVKDRSRQLSGCDVIIRGNGQEANIDEKATSHYMNTSTRNFAAEVMSTDRSGNIRQGWFVDKGLKTNAYIAEFINLREDKFPVIEGRPRENRYYEDMVAEDITSMEVAVMGKGMLQDALLSVRTKRGEPLTVKRLEEDAKYLLRSNRKSIHYDGGDLFMYHSTDRPESPVCLIIGPKYWKKAAIYHCNAYADRQPSVMKSSSRKVH